MRDIIQEIGPSDSMLSFLLTTTIGSSRDLCTSDHGSNSLMTVAMLPVLARGARDNSTRIDDLLQLVYTTVKKPDTSGGSHLNVLASKTAWSNLYTVGDIRVSFDDSDGETICNAVDEDVAVITASCYQFIILAQEASLFDVRLYVAMACVAYSSIPP